MQDKIMTQEEKELLLKDLSARLPYGVKVKYRGTVATLECIWSDGKCVLFDKDDRHLPFLEDRVFIPIEEVKPYLLPLSSMTEEQYEKFLYISGWDVDIEDIRRGKFSCIGYVGLDCMYDAIDWFNKNHFDYRGLIPMGLANDATGLNIYIK